MADNDTSRTPSSKHIFLHEVSQQPLGTKVRFLCCVNYYDESKGQLHVEHRYPVSSGNTSAFVNIDLVRGSLKLEQVQTGSWLNIIGYVRQVRKLQNAKSRMRAGQHGFNEVQAIVVWSAGAIRLNEYEQILRTQRDTLADADVGA